MVATAAHFAVFMFFPMLTAADFSFGVTELEAIELPPEVEIPPPPEALQRPAVPVVAQADLEEDITIAPTTFEENPVDQLPAPPSNVAAGLSDQPVFTPYTVAPRLKDPEAAAEIVRKAYPKTYMAAGIGGEVLVWAFIDAKGVVKNCQVQESSGHGGLDRAALKAVKQFSFLPARNYDRQVAVWVQMPIEFKVTR
jgi:protein TonB